MATIAYQDLIPKCLALEDFIVFLEIHLRWLLAQLVLTEIRNKDTNSLIVQHVLLDIIVLRRVLQMSTTIYVKKDIIVQMEFQKLNVLQELTENS